MTSESPVAHIKICAKVIPSPYKLSVIKPNSISGLYVSPPSIIHAIFVPDHGTYTRLRQADLCPVVEAKCPPFYSLPKTDMQILYIFRYVMHINSNQS